MSNAQSMIRDAVERAKARLGVSSLSEKVASAQTEDLSEVIKVAEALEFVALETANDGSLTGQYQETMLRNFFKQAAGPAVTATSVSGEQGQAPTGSRKKLLGNATPKGKSPPESKSPDGQMSRGVFEQPATDKKATAGNSLYDVLMASQKHAALGGPTESDADQDSAAPPKANENSNINLVRSNEAVVNATRREAKLPTRSRLAEVFDTARDTVGDATASAIWPNAAAKGDMKIAGASVADFARAFQKEAADDPRRPISHAEYLGAVGNFAENDDGEFMRRHRDALRDAGETGRKSLRRVVGPGVAGALTGAALGLGVDHSLTHRGIPGGNPLAMSLMGGIGGGFVGSAGGVAYDARKRNKVLGPVEDAFMAEKGFSKEKVDRKGLGRVLQPVLGKKTQHYASLKGALAEAAERFKNEHGGE